MYYIISIMSIFLMILPYIFDDFTTTYRHWCACKIGVYNITSRSTATKDHCTLRLYDCKCSIDFIKNDVFSNENSIHETNIAGLELWFPEENMHQSINIYIYTCIWYSISLPWVACIIHLHSSSMLEFRPAIQGYHDRPPAPTKKYGSKPLYYWL